MEDKINNKITFDDYVYSNYEYSHTEIGKRMGLTKNEVRSIERRAIEKIKQILISDQNNLNKILLNLIELNISDNKIESVLSRYEKLNLCDNK